MSLKLGTFRPAFRAGARQRGYDRQWEAVRARFLAANPNCLGCKAIGITVAATVVDHVLPHRGDSTKFKGSFLQPSCRWHHDVIKRKLEWLYEQGELVGADLWLNSKAAIELSRRFPQAQSVGSDGWPIEHRTPGSSRA